MAKRTSRASGLDLKDCPVYYPTEAEFRYPLRYIASVREEAEQYGMCRIVPPSSWRPPFALDREKFTFKTKVQAIHQLQERPSGCDPGTFLLEYKHFLDTLGLPVQDWPMLGGEALDLCKMFNAVRRRGGYRRVCSEQQWGEVLSMVKPDVGGPQSGEALKILQQLYEKYLLLYEEYHSGTSSGDNQKVASEVGLDGSRKKSGLSATGVGNFRIPELPIPGTEKLRSGEEVRLGGSLHAPEKETKYNQTCEQCKGGDHEQEMLLCDRCDRGWHMYCLSPPLESVPPGNWYCLECISSERELFGFASGQDYTLGAFHRMADRFKRCWFGSPARGASPSLGEVEGEFWRIVEQSSQAAEVLYGSDLDTWQYGSGFPRLNDPCPPGKDRATWEEYARSPWNLNNLAKQEGSMLRHVDDNIPGVIIPWLYIGMLFSSFCWHFEDHCFYSINYLHWGEPKVWYGVPGSAAEEFERVMKKAFPDLFEAQPDLLFQLVTMLNPIVLKGAGVPVYRTVQEARQFVITFPRSYHGGFNMGYNCAEAVNFAPPDWLPWGGRGVERYRLFRRSAIISHDELLCVCSKADERDPETLRWLRSEMTRIILSECRNREKLWLEGVTHSTPMQPHVMPDRIGQEEDPECIICHYYLHLSAVTCSCRPNEAVCLEHASRLCECPPSKRRLHYRHTLAELEDFLDLSLADDSKPALKLPSNNAQPMEQLEPPSKRRKLSGETAAKQQGQIGAEDVTEQAVRVGSRPPRRRPASKKKRSLVILSSKKSTRGRAFTLGELAAQWMARTRVVLRTPPFLESVEELLLQAEEFLWAGHDMDQMRHVVQRLKAAKQWAEDVMSCCHISSGQSELVAPVPSRPDSACGASVPLENAAEGRPKPSLARVQELLAVQPLPCELPKIKNLRDLAELAESLQLRVEQALKSSPPVEVAVLISLHEEARKSQLALPCVQQLDEMFSQFQRWQAAIGHLLSAVGMGGTADLSALPTVFQLHKLLREGEELPIQSAADLAHLRAEIDRVSSWQKQAAHLLQSFPTLAALEAAKKDCHRLPAQTAEALELTQRLERARRWLGTAAASRAQLVSKCAASKFASQEQENGARLTAYKDIATTFQHLLSEAPFLLVNIPEVEEVKEIASLLTWTLHVMEAQERLPPLLDLCALAAERNRLCLTCSSLSLPDMNPWLIETISAVRCWEESATTLLRLGGTLEQFEGLISHSAVHKYGPNMFGLRAVTRAFKVALGWLERAAPLLSWRQGQQGRASHDRVPATVLKALVRESGQMLVRLDEANTLRALLSEVDRWHEKAVELLNLSPVSADIGLPPIVTHSHGSAQMAPAPTRVLGEELSERWAVLGVALDDGLSLGVELTELEHLQRALHCCEWELRLQHLLASKPSLDAVERMLAEAQHEEVAVAEERLQSLSSVVSSARKWTAAAAELLYPPGGVGPQIDVKLLEELLAQGQDLPLVPPVDLGRVHLALTAHRTWEAQVQQALGDGREDGLATKEAPRVSWKELDALKTTGNASRVYSAELARLEAAMSSIRAWMQHCYRHVEKGSGLGAQLSLLELFTKMKDSVEAASAQAAHCPSAGGPGSRHVCACQVVPNERDIASMLRCDSCNDWFHPSCVGRARPRGKQFSCPFCLSLSSGLLPLDKVQYSKIYVTKRPTLAILKELLGAAQALPCILEERAVLRDVIQAADCWQRQLATELAPSLELKRGAAPITGAELVAALKSAGACEVAVDDLLRNAVAVHAWRMCACRLVVAADKVNPVAADKPPFKELVRVATQGRLLVGEEDCVLKELVQKQEAASAWIAKANQVLDDEAVPICDVEELISGGEALPWRLEEELEALRKRKTLICLCRKPLVRSGRVIGCVQCSELFHYTCLQMQEPPSSAKESCKGGDAHAPDFAAGASSQEARDPQPQGSEGCQSLPRASRTRGDTAGALNKRGRKRRRGKRLGGEGLVCPNCQAAVWEQERMKAEALQKKVALLKERAEELVKLQQERQIKRAQAEEALQERFWTGDSNRRREPRVRQVAELMQPKPTTVHPREYGQGGSRGRSPHLRTASSPPPPPPLPPLPRQRHQHSRHRHHERSSSPPARRPLIKCLSSLRDVMSTPVNPLGDPATPSEDVSLATPPPLPVAALRARRSFRSQLVNGRQLVKTNIGETRECSVEVRPPVAEEPPTVDSQVATGSRPCRRTAGRHSGFDGYVVLSRWN